jgi:hypothetical protein
MPIADAIEDEVRGRNMRLIQWGLMIAVLCLCGCSSATPASTVTSQAAFDLSCPAEQIQIQQLATYNYGVLGCGRKASYVANCTPFGSCIAVKQTN